MGRRRGRTVAVLVVVAVLAMAGAATLGDPAERGRNGLLRSTSDEGAGTSAPAAAEALSASAVAAGGGSVAAGGGSGAGAAEVAATSLPPGLGEARVIRTATLEVEVGDDAFGAAFSKIATIATANGGFVASSSSHQGRDDDGRPSAGSAVVRVPADNFDATRRQLIELGELRSERLAGDDVSAQLTDLGARLRNLRSHEEAVRLLMGKAVNVGETLEVQRQLSTVREQIEQLAAEEARLGDAVAFSTITVALAEPGAASRPDERSPLGDALARAVDGAEQVAAGAIVGLGYLLPLALVAGLAWLAVRGFRRGPLPAPEG